MNHDPRKRLGRGKRVTLLTLLLTAATVIAPVTSAAGQSIVEIYQKQRLHLLAEQALARQGGRYEVLPPEYLPSPLDTVRVARGAPAEVNAEPEQLRFSRWQLVPKLGQSWFEKIFSGQDWVFVGNSRVTPLDTMMTRDIRARLEAHFGKPTRTLGDFELRADVAGGTIFEFEYWFILNDSIPLVVTDVNGPFERGVAASTVARYESELLPIRDAFLSVLVESDRRAPYVDYYYDDEELQWYRVGYDGSVYFVRSVERPGLNRPVLSR